jgi:hypothetical protein
MDHRVKPGGDEEGERSYNAHNPEQPAWLGRAQPA